MEKQIFYCDYCGEDFDINKRYQFDDRIEFKDGISHERFDIDIYISEDSKKHICMKCYYRKLILACKAVLYELCENIK